MTSPTPFTSDIVFEHYVKQIKSGDRRPNIYKVAQLFGVTRQAVNAALGQLEAMKRLVIRSDKLYLIVNGQIQTDSYKRNSAEAREKKSTGGKTAAAILRKRAEDAGMKYSAFAHIPSGEDQKIAERIEKIVADAIGAGTCYRNQLCRPRGTKAG